MDIQKEREAFEKECRLLCYKGNMVMSNLGSFYNNEQTNWMWQMWLSAKAQAVPEWISVNDKMPDEGDEVFVHHYGHIVQATKDQKYSGGFKQRNCYGWEAVSSYISHWMPMSVVLPESYHFYYGKPAKKAQEQSHV